MGFETTTSNHITTSLALNTKIYRIIDFFEVISIVNNQAFRFMRATEFDDINEGIETILKGLLLSATPCRGGLRVAWEGNREEAFNAMEKAKHSAYVSCWTTSRDSVAMWSLYSTSFLGVRVQTTIGKLLEALSIAQENNSFAKNYKNEAEFTTGFSQCYVEPVTYLDVEKFFKKVRTRRKALIKIESRARDRATEIKAAKTRDYFTAFGLPTKTYLVKDNAYKHEQEIRAVINTFNVNHAHYEYILSQGRPISPDFNIKNVSELIEKYESQGLGMPSSEVGDFPEKLFIDIKDNFIEEACFDPRCPEFKRQEMSRLLSEKGIRIGSTNAFGFSPDDTFFDAHDLPVD